MSAMPAPVLLEEVRKRKVDKRTELQDLRDEVTAAGLEMVAMSERITNVLVAGDSHSAMHFAARLGALGRSYLTPEPGDAA